MMVTPLDAWVARRIGGHAPLVRSELLAYQLRHLQQTLGVASHGSRFYRGRLPTRISGLDEMSELPFTTADDLRSDPMAFVCGSQGRISRIVTLDTSGTTGHPKRIAFTAQDQELTIDFFAVGMSTFTRPGDRVAILLPGDTPGSVGDLLSIALRRIDAVPIVHGPVADAGASLERLLEDRADVAVGIPTHLLAMVRQGSRKPPLRDVLVSTDHRPDAIVRTVESAWGCTVYDHYGMTEMGLGGGVECAARDGYHLREADLLFEVIDPDTGVRVPDGDIGEVVFTTLTRAGMPLVRYRTGDMSRFLPGPCPCGSDLRRLERVRIRLDGRIGLADGVVTMATFDEAVFAVDGVVDFTVAITGGDLVRLGVKSSGPLPAEQLRAAVIGAIGRDIELQIHAVDDIPLSPAKRRIVVERA